MDLASEKKRLRERVGALRDAMTAQEHAECSDAICERLWQLCCDLSRSGAATKHGSGKRDDLPMQAVNPTTRLTAGEQGLSSTADPLGGFALAAYMPHRSEVDIAFLIERLWRAGLPVALPKAERREWLLRFYYARGAADLAVGAYGIREPLPSLPEATDAELAALDVLLVPGLAFDESLRRLGYGGGYYDRLLARLAAPRTDEASAKSPPASSGGLQTGAAPASLPGGGPAQLTSTPAMQPGVSPGSWPAGGSSASSIVAPGAPSAHAAPTPRRRPLLVAAAFELQFVNAVPTEMHDLPLDAIVTERRVILPK
jgi:5,10-methenyltetrahydrofolate synthetase